MRYRSLGALRGPSVAAVGRWLTVAAWVALAGCARSRADGEPGHEADAGPADAGLPDGPVDGGTARDAGIDAVARDAGELGPCEDPELWAREPDWVRSEPFTARCGATNLAQWEFVVPASEACFRVLEAAPATGHVPGDSWRGTQLPSGVVVSSITFRNGVGPLVIAARYVQEGSLIETRFVPETFPRTPYLADIEASSGSVRPGGRRCRGSRS